MRRLYLAASGLGLSVAVSLAMANGPDDAFRDRTVPPAFESDVTEVIAAEVAEEPAQLSDPEAVLREEYLKLMQEKAALMDKASLEAALSAAQQDIQELEADKLLDEAKAILARVSQEYPQTKAANEASVLMRQAESLDAPHYAPSSGSFKPL
jgi:hypothetical protein